MRKRGFRPGPTQTGLNGRQKMARGWKFLNYVVEGLYYPYSENKCADQLRSYCATHAKSRFSHNEAHIVCVPLVKTLLLVTLSWSVGHYVVSVTVYNGMSYLILESKLL